MAHISLRAYVEYIEDRLARDALTEVVAQCRHVLESYPKLIDVYRLLARTLMEQEKNQDALDLFQRVLSADPNDFVAHIGISEVYHEIGSLDSAIWHLERAYEQAPSNIDLQEAIKELYGERDGQAPRKIHLTNGALARMYANGKLYDQALLELRKALASDPERLDLQVLMANTLWDSHQYVEAGKLAGAILRRLPNSVDANALLARMWLEFGKLAEAQPFLNNVKQLSPYLAYEIEKGEEAPSDAFKLLMLDYTADLHATEIGAADWVSEIGSIAKERGVTGPLPIGEEFEVERPASISDRFGQAEPEPTPSQPQESPDWLADALVSTSAPVEPEEYAPVEQPPPVQPSQPDWLSEALGSAGVTTMADEAEPAADTAPAQEWTQEEPGPAPEPVAGMSAPTESDAPDWMQEVLGAGASAAPPPLSTSSTEVPDWMHEAGIAPASAPDLAGSPGDSDVPDWLAETLGQSLPSSQPPIQEAAPDWLADALGPSGDIQPEHAPDMPEGDTPDWLAETLGTAKPSAEVTPASDEAIPDWMTEMTGMPEVESPIIDAPELPDLEPAPSPLADRSAPGWLDDILSGEPEDATPAGHTEQVAAEVVSDDWLDDFLGSDEPEISSETEEDWLADLDLEPAVEESIEAEPSASVSSLPPGTLETWNQASTRMAAGRAGPASLTTNSTMEADQPGELPDWLADGTDEAPAATDESGGSSGELPDWLAAAESLVSDRSPSDEFAGQGDMPDWLASAAPPVDEASSEENQTDEDDGGLPDWLQQG